MKVGIGTYSFGGIASYLGLGPTLPEKFRLIRALGYEQVELLPVDLDNDIAQIRSWLDETGLEAVSVHAEPTEEIVRKMAALGGKAVIWAGTPFSTREEAIEVARQLDSMAEMAAPYGIRIGYHNHSKEFFFDQGKTLLEHLMDNSSKCFAQLDCGWAQNGGMYPPYFIRKYRDRILSIHVKENSKVVGPGPRPAPRQAGTQPSPFANVLALPLEERQKILEQINAFMSATAGDFDVQCPMGAPESNMDWKEIRAALNEQAFEAFWIVEREGFYGDHDTCLREDCAWLRANIV